jgi:hypothetical protein
MTGVCVHSSGRTPANHSYYRTAVHNNSRLQGRVSEISESSNIPHTGTRAVGKGCSVVSYYQLLVRLCSSFSIIKSAPQPSLCHGSPLLGLVACSSTPCLIEPHDRGCLRPKRSRPVNPSLCSVSKAFHHPLDQIVYSHQC